MARFFFFCTPSVCNIVNRGTLYIFIPRHKNKQIYTLFLKHIVIKLILGTMLQEKTQFLKNRRGLILNRAEDNIMRILI